MVLPAQLRLEQRASLKHVDFGKLYPYLSSFFVGTVDENGME